MDDYLKERQLRKGVANWILLAGLGVSYVISGEFAGWNFGLAAGGFGGLLIATIIMAIMYFSLVLTIAELSAALPTSGGGYSFARRAFGTWGGFLTGTAIVLEYMIVPAAIVIFTGHYINSLIGINGPIIYAMFYILFIALHLWGVGEALKIMMGITLIAIIALIVFIIGAVPHFDSANLTKDTLLPNGYTGVWAALPFAMWFFLAIEGVPLAAEETKNPTKDISYGIISAMLILIILASFILFLAPGAIGTKELAGAEAPLVETLARLYGHDANITKFVNIIAISGLVASFFSAIYAYSRQIFSLSRAGYLPKFLSLCNHKQIPSLAIIIPGIIGFILSLTGQGDLLINIAVFGATISYALISLSHIVLRFKEPNLSRPYKTPGGIVTSSLTLMLSIIAFSSTFVVNITAALYTAAIYILMILYFGFYSRHKIVKHAPEEAFSL